MYYMKYLNLNKFYTLNYLIYFLLISNFIFPFWAYIICKLPKNSYDAIGFIYHIDDLIKYLFCIIFICFILIVFFLLELFLRKKQYIKKYNNLILSPHKYSFYFWLSIFLLIIDLCIFFILLKIIISIFFYNTH